MTAMVEPRPRTGVFGLSEGAIAKLAAGLIILALWEIGCRAFASPEPACTIPITRLMGKDPNGSFSVNFTV